MRYLLALFAVVFTTIAHAAPSANCVNKFAGVWNHGGLAGGNKGTLTRDGRAICTENAACQAEGTWTCSGNTMTYTTGMGSYLYTLQPDGSITANGGAARATRIGAAPAASREAAAQPKPIGQAPKPASTPKLSSSDGDCSDVSGLAGPRIECKRSEGRKPTAAPPKPKEVAAKPSPPTTTDPTGDRGRATQLLSELFPEAAIVKPVPAKEPETTQIKPVPPAQSEDTLTPDERDRLTKQAMGYVLSAQAVLAQDDLTCASYDLAASQLRNAATWYKILKDENRREKASRYAEKIQDIGIRIRVADKCGALKAVNRKKSSPKPPEVKAGTMDCKKQFEAMQKNFQYSTDYLVRAYQQVDAGCSADGLAKATLRQCVSASVAWANLSKPELDSRLAKAQCPKF
jgi:hypothetical protein